MARKGNRTYGIERQGTRMYVLAQNGLAKRCKACGGDFVVADVAGKLFPLSISPDYCSQFCYDATRGEYDDDSPL